MAIGIDFTRSSKEGVQWLARDIRRLSQEVSRKRRGLFKDIRDEAVIPAIRRNFEKGSSGFPPTKFAPISPQTRAWRTKRGYNPNNPPLTASGRMRRMAQHPSRFKISARGDRMTYGNWGGSTRHFAPKHDFGDSERKPPLPSRPFTLLDGTALRQIDFITIRWIERFIDKNFRGRGRQGIIASAGGRTLRRGSALQISSGLGRSRGQTLESFGTEKIFTSLGRR